jgi:hypothetical protein
MSLAPALFSVTAWVLFPFTSTFPKFRAVVLSVIFDAALAPDPLSLTLVEDPPRDVIALNVPDELSVVVPVYVTWNLAD